MAGFRKTLRKLEGDYEYQDNKRAFWFNFYQEFFLRLITNYFDWKNLPPSIDKLFLEKNLCTQGFLGFFEHEDFGLVVTRGAMGSGLDIYDNPTEFKPVTNGNKINFKSVGINWFDDMLDRTKAVIIGNNNYRTPSTSWVNGFANQLADIEIAIQLNRNAQNRPFVVMVDDRTVFSLKNMMSKILQGEPIVYVKTQKTPTGELKAIQLNDLVQTLDLKTDFLLDKLHDEKQRVINQFLTLVGINNNAVDKAERLVKAEATANNGLINACIEIQLASRRESVKRINRCWNLEIEVMPTQQIEMYNTEVVNDTLKFEENAIINEGEYKYE